MKKTNTNINEGVFRSPKWLRNFLDFELHTGEDIKGKVSKAEVRRKWEKKWASISEKDFEKFYADEFPNEYKTKHRSCLLSNDFRQIRDEWYGNFELWDKYDKWEKKKREEEETQARIKNELTSLHNRLVDDFNRNPYSDKFYTNMEGGSTTFHYTFENGDTLKICENKITYGSTIYTVSRVFRNQFIKTANDIMDNARGRGKYQKGNQQKAKKTSNWSSHPKGNIYQSIKDTITQRKEQLSKMSRNDPDRVALENELASAERRLKEMNTKYKFESIISSFALYNEAYKLYGDLQYSDVEELKKDLEDVLIELRDDGYNTEVKFSKDYKMHLFITFLDYQSKTATWEQIKEYVDRVNTITSNLFKPTCIYYKVMEGDGRVFNRNLRDFISWEGLPSLLDSLSAKKPYYTADRKFCFFSIEYIEKDA